MIIEPLLSGYMAYHGKYIAYAQTREICMARIFSWMKLDLIDESYRIGGMVEDYDIAREREVCE